MTRTLRATSDGSLPCGSVGGLQREGFRQQAISGQDGRTLAGHDMERRPPPPQRVVVHRRKVIVNQ